MHCTGERGVIGFVGHRVRPPDETILSCNENSIYAGTSEVMKMIVAGDLGLS